MKIDLKLLTTQKETLMNMISMMSGNNDVVEDLTGLLHLVDAIQDECESDIIKLESTGKFPNGFSEWIETHHEVVAEIERAINIPTSKVSFIAETKGTGGLYELAEFLTDKFEILHAGKEWDGEFFDTIHSFLERELYHG